MSKQAKKATKTPAVKTAKIILTHEERSMLAEIAAKQAHSTMTASKEYDRLDKKESRGYSVEAQKLRQEYARKFPRLRARLLKQYAKYAKKAAA